MALQTDARDRPGLAELVSSILDMIDAPASYRGTTTHELIAAKITEFVASQEGFNPARKGDEFTCVV